MPVGSSGACESLSSACRIEQLGVDAVGVFGSGQIDPPDSPTVITLGGGDLLG
jgi:hypothetical protein